MDAQPLNFYPPAQATVVSKIEDNSQQISIDAILALFALPFNELLFRAHQVHRTHFDPNQIQLSTLLSIKTGGCTEDCGYCAQSSRYHTQVEKQALLSVEEVLEKANLKGPHFGCALERSWGLHFKTFSQWTSSSLRPFT